MNELDTIATERGRLDRRMLIGGGVAAGLIALDWSSEAHAATASDIDHRADRALALLYRTSDRARELGAKSRAILIFPKIAKAGVIMVGGQTGEGVLRRNGRSVGYYRISAANFGLQAGAQTFSYALFFITEASLEYLDKSNGWALGSGPSIVVVDDGYARSMNTTTLTQDVYAMPFGQRGLMANLGIEGSKITRIDPEH